MYLDCARLLEEKCGNIQFFIGKTILFCTNLSFLMQNRGSGDRYLNHLYTIEKWHVQQESIQIAESITLY